MKFLRNLNKDHFTTVLIFSLAVFYFDIATAIIIIGAFIAYEIIRGVLCILLD
jgi:hypothetical protein